MTAIKIREKSKLAMTCLANHPQKNVIRLQLKQNVVLQGLIEEDRAQLEPHLVIVDGNRGEFLLQQGVREMEQYFILEGILKHVVANKEGKEMILRFADERDMETGYAAWRLGTPTPYGIVCVTKARVARMPLKQWAAFLEPRNPEPIGAQREDLIRPRWRKSWGSAGRREYDGPLGFRVRVEPLKARVADEMLLAARWVWNP